MSYQCLIGWVVNGWSDLVTNPKARLKHKFSLAWRVIFLIFVLQLIKSTTCTDTARVDNQTSQQSDGLAERSDIYERLLTVTEIFPPFEGITAPKTRQDTRNSRCKLRIEITFRIFDIKFQFNLHFSSSCPTQFSICHLTKGHTSTETRTWHWYFPCI